MSIKLYKLSLLIIFSLIIYFYNIIADIKQYRNKNIIVQSTTKGFIDMRSRKSNLKENVLIFPMLNKCAILKESNLLRKITFIFNIDEVKYIFFRS